MATHGMLLACGRHVMLDLPKQISDVCCLCLLAGTWGMQFGLMPSIFYVFILSYAWPITITNANAKVDMFVQAFGPGE